MNTQRNVLKDGNIIAWPLLCYSYGTVEFAFNNMKSQAVFSDLDKRREFLTRLLPIQGFDYPLNDETIVRLPSVSVKALVDAADLDKLIDALKWFVAQVRSPDHDGSG
jgi:hypothetical protein